MPNMEMTYPFEHLVMRSTDVIGGVPSYSYLILDMSSDVVFDDVSIEISVYNYSGLVSLDLSSTVGFSKFYELNFQ